MERGWPKQLVRAKGRKGWDMWSDLYPIVSGEMWLPQRAGLGPS